MSRHRKTTWAEIEHGLKGHVGHTIKYGTPAWVGGSGKLLRVVYDEAIPAVKMWVDIGDAFPAVAYSDQMQSCSCGKNLWGR